MLSVLQHGKRPLRRMGWVTEQRPTRIDLRRQICSHQTACQRSQYIFHPPCCHSARTARYPVDSNKTRTFVIDRKLGGSPRAWKAASLNTDGRACAALGAARQEMLRQKAREERRTAEQVGDGAAGPFGPDLAGVGSSGVCRY
jgi:hypothetical protein